MIIIAAILFIAVLVIDLWIDYDKWQDGHPIDHRKKWERGLLLLPTIALLAFRLPGSIVFGVFYAWALVGFTYWTIFDGVFNLIRREPWNFTGTVDKDDAKLDLFQRKFKWFWLLKIIISIFLKVGYIIMIL